MKTFVARSGFIKVADNEFIGGSETNNHKQGTLLINATSKKAALEKMLELGYHETPTSVRVGSGVDMEALLDAGVLNEESLLLLPDNWPSYVARVWIDDNGDRKVERIGEIVHDKDTPTYAYKFIAA